jgi:Ca2+-binding EF-hand superfamily protein
VLEEDAERQRRETYGLDEPVVEKSMEQKLVESAEFAATMAASGLTLKGLRELLDSVMIGKCGPTGGGPRAIYCALRQQQRSLTTPLHVDLHTDRVTKNDRGVTNNDRGVTKNDRGVTKNDRGVTTNDGGVTTNDGGVTKNDRGVTKNDRGVTKNDRGVIKNDRGVTKNDRGVTKNDRGVTKNDRGVTTNDGGVTKNDRGVTKNDRGVTTDLQHTDLSMDLQHMDLSMDLQQFRRMLLATYGVTQEEAVTHLFKVLTSEPVLQFGEMARLVGTLRHGNDRQMASALFRIYGCKRTGQITQREVFFMLLASPDPPNKDELSEMVSAIWAHLDLNGDGRLDKNEFVEVSQPQRRPHYPTNPYTTLRERHPKPNNCCGHGVAVELLVV